MMTTKLKPMLYAGAILSFLLHTACSTAVFTAGQGSKLKEQSSTDNSWTTHAKVIVKKVENYGAAEFIGAWAFHEKKSGGSTVIELKQYHQTLGSFDGRSLRHIVIQLPEQLKQGKKFQLRTIPAYRSLRKSADDERIAEMRDGEITTFEFSNPFRGSIVSAKEASVEIISLTDKEAVIRLILKAEIEPDWELDIDESFTIKVDQSQRP